MLNWVGLRTDPLTTPLVISKISEIDAKTFLKSKNGINDLILVDTINYVMMKLNWSLFLEVGLVYPGPQLNLRPRPAKKIL